MIKALISDFSRVLIFPKDSGFWGSLNDLHQQLTDSQYYSVLNQFELNTELLDFYTSLVEKITIYMYTSGTLQEEPEIAAIITPVFRKIISASNTGLRKSDKESYEAILKELHLELHEALFIDDSETNIEAAKSAGLQTILHQNNENTIARIKDCIEML